FITVFCFIGFATIPCNGQYVPLWLQQSYALLSIPRFIPNQVIIYFEPGTNLAQILALYTLYGLKEISSSPLSGARTVLTSPLVDLQTLIVRLNMEAIVLLAEPNYIGKVAFIPNDPYYRYQWNLQRINAESAWDLSTGLGVVVAVLDTGVAFENFDIYAQAPDLSGTSFTAGWDFVNDDAYPDDDAGHGTHITGTIAQTTNNLYGCAGLAFKSTIMPVKVMDSNGNGTLTDIVNGIYFAVNNGANVINMSFGFGNNPTVSLETAVNYAYNNGVTMVCSAGNNATDLPNYPASYPVCISVSGVRYDLTLGDYSNYGAEIDVCAPGGDLAVDQNLDGYPDGILQQSHDGTNYTVFSMLLGKGTSWSAAHVTGVVALMQSMSGGILTPDQVDLILKQTALDLGVPGWDQYYGYGLVNAFAAVVASSQATIATAEAIFLSSSLLSSNLLSTNLLLSSLPQFLPAQTQFINPVLVNQAQSSTNPIATINGDLSTLNSLFTASYPLTFQTYPFYSSYPNLFALTGLNQQFNLALPGYINPLPFSIPFSALTGTDPLFLLRGLY
ncbi:MAG: S8 family peptidase, partial [bacterium]